MENYATPACDCGATLEIDTDTCKTSSPCQHSARCPACRKKFTVFGLDCSKNLFTRDLSEAFCYDRKAK